MKDVLARLGIKDANLGTFNGEWIGKVDESRVLNVESSIDGSHIAKVYQASEEDYDAVIGKAHEKFLKWRMFPAPKRGEIVRQIGEELRKHKSDLGKLVTFEMGKIVSEGEGEVQEMIDIA
ncbi:MAG: aldehyde dehydrogenase family protein, partial [Planctomycetes bacterium]|nr:aldehyde dehydrogenase family protein [Planctomycetota bacterium]